MKKTVKKPKKEWAQVVLVDYETSFNNPVLISHTLDSLFDSLKEKAKRSLIMEKLKKDQDGICIRAWILPANKVPPQTTTPPNRT